MTFFFIFTTVYGLMNLLVYSQIVSLLGPTGRVKWLLRLLFVLMIIAPSVSMLWSDRTGPIAAVTFLWLGLIFYLFMASVDALFFRLIGGKRLARPVFIVLGLISVGAVAWGTYQARNPQLHEVVITTDKLPQGVNELRLIQITDVHLFSVEAESRLRRILNLIEDVDYDMLISTGDLIEIGTHRCDWQPLSDMLAQIKPRLGKWSINGNHELYVDSAAGERFSDRFNRRAGFKAVGGQACLPTPWLKLVGLNDPGRGGLKKPNRILERQLLSTPSLDVFTILLKHQPNIELTSLGKFDLMMSGHTHGGQMWPFPYVVQTRYEYYKGLYKLDKGSSLLVSVGAGTWGPPVRVGVPPEVVLIRLVRPKINTS